jgi:hypothetical protein
VKGSDLCLFQREIGLTLMYVCIHSIFIIIMSPLMSLLLGHKEALPYELHIKRTGHNLPRGLSACWWMLTATNAAGNNGLTCLPKHGGARDIKFLITHPMTDQRCTIASRSALTAGPSSSSCVIISQSMSPQLGHRPSIWIAHKENEPLYLL